MIRNCLLFILFASLSFAKPTISTDGIVSAASYLPSGFPNSGIAQGSIFIVFGSGMGPAAIVQNNAFPLQEKLGGTSVDVTVNGTTTHALMIYTVAGQVAAILPSATPTGDGTLTVTYNGSASDPAPIHVIKNGFGIFTINQAGTGPAVATFADYSVVTLIATGTDRPQTLARPAKPGEVLILWGTGLGAVTGVDESQPAVGGDMKNLAATVFVGGKSAQIQYKGRSPGSAGLDQINFKVPAGVTGCFVPVAVQAGGVLSNFGSIAISTDGKTCKDPATDSAGHSPVGDVLAKLQAQGKVTLGLVQLSRFGVFFNLAPLSLTIQQDTGSGYFYSVNKQQFLSSLGVASLNPFGSCVVWACRGAACVPPTQGAATALLDAGAALTVNGPNGPKQLTKTNSGSYSAALGGGSISDPKGYLEPGQYTLTGTGGSGANAIGAFTAGQTLTAAPLTWSITSAGQSGGTISRSSDVALQWSGGAPNGYVSIIGTSTSDATADAGQVTATFGCTAQGASGQFTIPSWVLSALPKSGSLSQGGITVSNGFLLMGTYPAFTPFNAPNLDLGYFTNIVLSGQNVAYQ